MVIYLSSAHPGWKPIWYTKSPFCILTSPSGSKDIALLQLQQNKPLDYGLQQACRGKLGLLRAKITLIHFYSVPWPQSTKFEVTGISYTLRYRQYQDTQEMALPG